MASKAVWLYACAASLAALLLAGIFYNLGQNNPRPLADVDLTKTNSPRDADLKPAPQNAPSGSASEAENDESIAKKEQPAPPAADSLSEDLGKRTDRSEPAVGIAQVPSSAAMVDQIDKSNVQAIDDGSLDKELSQQVAPSPVGQLQNREAFGGGGGGHAKVDADAMAKDGAKPSSGQVDAPSGDLGQPTAPTDTCLNLDRFIFVQVPADQPAEEWIASVFRQAEVQVDPSDEPNSFTELLKERDSKKLAPAQLDNGRALSTAEKQEAKDAGALAEKSQPELSPAPEYLKPDRTTTAYWVDAEVRQIRTIMDRLDGAVIVGFSSTGMQNSRGEERPQQQAFDGKGSHAQRLPQLDVPPRLDNSLDDNRPNRLQDEEKLSEAQLAIEALGLQYQPLATRVRILFVFHGSASPAAMKSDALESKPAPVK